MTRGRGADIKDVARRLPQLFLGLVLFGASVGLMLEAALGVAPWDVFHQGVAKNTPLSVGTITILTSVVVLLLWIPLRQKPGIGTVSNAVLVGLTMDATLAVVPDVDALGVRMALLATGILLNGVATGMYIGAALGPGPRDGLMTGIAARGVSLRLARTSIEITVLVTGWLLGGTVGVGTVLYALSIGPLAQIFIPAFDRYPGSHERTHSRGSGHVEERERVPAADPPEAPLGGR